MTHFLFAHGFGFNRNFWDNLAPHFIKEKCTFLDFGYFQNPTTIAINSSEEIVGIGHSLGLIKLMREYKNAKCMFGLNGFSNFLGNNKLLRKKRLLELEALKSYLIQDPINTLKNFYNRCGVDTFINLVDIKNINLELLLSDLELLKNQAIIPNIPIQILASKNDIIVPYDIINDNFACQNNVKVDFVDNTKHATGFLEPHLTYKKIMSFLDDEFSG